MSVCSYISGKQWSREPRALSSTNQPPLPLPGWWGRPAEGAVRWGKITRFSFTSLQNSVSNLVKKWTMKVLCWIRRFHYDVRKILIDWKPPIKHEIFEDNIRITISTSTNTTFHVPKWASLLQAFSLVWVSPIRIISCRWVATDYDLFSPLQLTDLRIYPSSTVRINL